MEQGWGERKGENKPTKVISVADSMVRVTIKTSLLSEMTYQRLGGYCLEVESPSVHVLPHFF